MKTSELTKEIKAKIETYTYDGIDDAIKLAEEHRTPDFFDKFLGELQLRCVRYNSDHVCSKAKFFNLGMRGRAMYFKYRALLDGGKTYRAFLEGRIKENAYLLLIHLSNLELKGLI